MKITIKQALVVMSIPLLIASMATPASSLVAAAIGETVVLSGGGGGYDTIYLFLTGPNLAPGGVRLDSVSSTVVSGEPSTFTRATVDGGRWEYSWETRSVGGSLDAGTYLVWATPVPLGRYDLAASGENYATIGVALTGPALTAGIATIPTGSLRVTSDPAGAEVSVNSVQYGTTPLMIEDLAGGPAMVRVEKDGYDPHEEEVVIRTGTLAVLDVTLTPEALPTETIPQSESPTESSSPEPSTEPTRTSAPWCGVVGGIVLSLAGAGFLNKNRDK
jgi:hypothetical protein